MREKDELIPTRRSLLDRLKDWEDQESWKVFFDTYWKLIYSAALKAGLLEEEAQDVVQETVVAVMKSMAAFDYRTHNPSFKSWLLRLTSWRIMDQIRKRQRRIKPRNNARTGTGTSTVERVADPSSMNLELIWDEEWERNLMDTAIERVKRKVDAKDYQMFDLYVFKEWPVARIAQILKVSQSKVYLTKHRLTRLIKKEVTHLRARPI